MKDFRFGMLYYETKLFEQNCHYIITTKQTAVRNMEQFALGNEETIINERNEENKNFEMFKTFLKDVKKVKSQ